VLMLDKAFCAVLLLDPEITERGDLAGGGVAGDGVARGGKKDLSDISSLSENATKKILQIMLHQTVERSDIGYFYFLTCKIY